jgi:hypothetical protein
MLKSHIKPGIRYALRERGTRELQCVKILEHIRGSKWKAEWINPNRGLVHYVESGDLVVAWKERKAFLRDEVNAAALHQHNEQQGFKRDSPIDDAVCEIFESTGERDISFWRGELTADPEAIDRIRVRAGVEAEKNSPYAYVDRRRKLHLPFDEALTLVRRFCVSEPATVLSQVEGTERKWASEARRPGEEHLIGPLNESRASWALIRQWAGQDAALAQRDAEIQNLERLVWDAIYALQKAGLDSEAARLRRVLERR